MPYKLLLERASKNGKHTGEYKVIIDEKHGNYDNGCIDMFSFVIDLPLRDILITRESIEDLSHFPTVIFSRDRLISNKGEECTEQKLKEIIQYIEKWTGKLEVKQPTTKQEEAVYEYLKQYSEVGA